MGESSCLFCQITNRDIPATIVYEDDNVLAFNDLNPQAPVHVLIIPKIHIQSSHFVSDENKNIMAELIFASQKIAAKQGIDNKGYRLVMNHLAESGQSVFHLHMHLLGGRQMTWPPG